MKSMRVVRSVLPTLLLITACSGGRDRESHRLRHYREDGVRVTESMYGPKYQGDLFSFEVILRLEEDPENEESLLYSPRSVTMDQDGYYYVVDGRNYRVAVFDQDGNYERSFGRQGAGPGEFEWIELAQFEGEVLTFWDSNLNRATRYNRDGTFLDSQLPPGGHRVGGMLFAPEDRLLLFGNHNQPRDGFAWTSARVVVVSDRGDTLAFLETGSVVTGTHQTTSIPGGGIRTRQQSIPFRTWPLTLYSPGQGILLTSGGEPEVRWYDLSGDCVAIHRLDLKRQRVTQELKNTYEEGLRRSAREAAERTGREPRPIPDQFYPEHLGFWTGGFVDDVGYLWLRIIELPWESNNEKGDPFYVLDPDGCWLGTAWLPSFRATIRSGRLLARVNDEETGAMVPTIYRIRSAVEGLRYP